MRIALLFHKNPFTPPASIDLIRLRAIAFGLQDLGSEVEIVAPIRSAALLAQRIPIVPTEALAERGRYHVVKACYHFSIELLGAYEGPLVCRLVRVVDQKLPLRDELWRRRLLDCQAIAAERASAVVLNNRENRTRWHKLYGHRQEVILVPTGCPKGLPVMGLDPYRSRLPIVLFLGSLAAPRMVRLLNRAAGLLKGSAEVHLVGRSKIHLYGAGHEALTGDVVDHGEYPEEEAWDFVRHARIGLALAAGPNRFDNDVSKIVTYLRGGLPTLAEDRIVTNRLITQTGFGDVFRYGDVDDLVFRVNGLLRQDFALLRPGVMTLLQENHCWENRALILHRFFSRLLDESTVP